MAALNYAVLMHPNASGHTGYFKPWFGAIILLFYYSFWRRGYPRPPWRPLGPPCAPMTPALFHNLKGTQILYTLTYLDIRGAIKKQSFVTSNSVGDQTLLVPPRIIVLSPQIQFTNINVGHSYSVVAVSYTHLTLPTKA